MRLVIGYAALRIAYALALLVAPGRVARPWLGEAAGALGAAGAALAVRTQ